MEYLPITRGQMYFIKSIFWFLSLFFEVRFIEEEKNNIWFSYRLFFIRSFEKVCTRATSNNICLHVYFDVVHCYTAILYISAADPNLFILNPDLDPGQDPDPT